MRFLFLLTGYCVMAGLLFAQQQAEFPPEAVAFYDAKVRPVLRANCLPCHTQRNRTSGLSFASRDDLLTGGNRGPGVKPGAPDESLLMAAVEQRGDLKMPPAGRLKDEQIAALREWIERGAPWMARSRQREAKRPGWDHWAFQPPKRREPPAVTQPGVGAQSDRQLRRWRAWNART